MSGNSRKNLWTAEEDAFLRAAVVTVQEIAVEPGAAQKKEGAISWSQVAAHVPSRTGKQCRERWAHHLLGSVRKAPWTSEEDRVLFAAMQEHATHWVEIAKQLPGRTGHCVKNHYYSTKRRLDRAARKRTVEASASTALLGFQGEAGLEGEDEHENLAAGAGAGAKIVAVAAGRASKRARK